MGVALFRRIDDLTWYFNSAESALGLSSNYSAILAMGFRGPSAGADYEPIYDGMIDAATRFRKVRARLARCSPRAHRILRAAYSHTLAHPQLVAQGALGDLVQVALLDATERELLRLVARGVAAELADLRARCRSALQAAEREFMETTSPARAEVSL